MHLFPLMMSNAGIQTEAAVSIPAEGKGYLRRMLPRCQLQGLLHSGRSIAARLYWDSLGNLSYARKKATVTAKIIPASVATT